MTDDSDDSELLRSEDETDDRSELMDDPIELSDDDASEAACERLSVEVVVTVVVDVLLPDVVVEVEVSVVWAAAREARARTATEKRILAVFWA
jgi:hypothetical protein